MQEMPTGARILIVDDDHALVRGLTVLLSSEGHDVISLESGRGVEEAVARRRPDLVVLDVMMPVMDGWEVLSRIRANSALDRLPVMMLTAKGTEDAKVRGFNLGADDYLPKPFSIPEFMCRVEALLRRRRLVIDDAEPRLPVVDGKDVALVPISEICYVDGIRNYTYVHTHDARFLSRLRLREVDERALPGLMRVHRSYVVRLGAVKALRQRPGSAVRLVLDDAARSEIPVSREKVAEVRTRLGLR